MYLLRSQSLQVEVPRETVWEGPHTLFGFYIVTQVNLNVFSSLVLQNKLNK